MQQLFLMSNSSCVPGKSQTQRREWRNGSAPKDRSLPPAKPGWLRADFVHSSICLHGPLLVKELVVSRHVESHKWRSIRTDRPCDSPWRMTVVARFGAGPQTRCTALGVPVPPSGGSRPCKRGTPNGRLPSRKRSCIIQIAAARGRESRRCGRRYADCPLGKDAR